MHRQNIANEHSYRQGWSRYVNISHVFVTAHVGRGQGYEHHLRTAWYTRGSRGTTLTGTLHEKGLAATLLVWFSGQRHVVHARSWWSSAVDARTAAAPPVLETCHDHDRSGAKASDRQILRSIISDRDFGL